MTDKTLTELSQIPANTATSVSDEDLLYIVQGGVSKAVDVATFNGSSLLLNPSGIDTTVIDTAGTYSFPAFAWPDTLSAPAVWHLDYTTTSASTLNGAGLSVQMTASATAPAAGAPSAISAGTLVMRDGLDAVGILGYINNDSSVASPVGPAIWGLIRGNMSSTGQVDGFRATAENTPTATATVTISIASPAVITWTGHGLSAGDAVFFSSTGSVPTGISTYETYYVLAAGLTSDTFRIAPRPAGTAIDTSGTQSGVHSGYIVVNPRAGLHITNTGQTSFATGILITSAEDYGVRVGIDANNVSPTHPYSFWGFATPTAWPAMTELWYIDNAGNETVTSITASSTIVSSSTITGTSFAATSVGSTFGTGSGGVAGYFSSNLDGQFPSTNSGLAIGSNKSGGSSEVDFINSNTASLVSFNFYQQTGASAVTLLASILPTSGIKIPISLAAATSGDGLTLTNDTAATVGNQSYSPRLRLTGQGWKTDATSASQTVDWIIENEPLQGAANPSTRLYFKSQINGGGYNTRMYLYDNVAGTQSTLSLDNSSSSQIELNVGGNTALFLYADGAQLLLGSQFNLPLKFYTNNTEKARLSGSVFSPGADDGTALGSTSLQWSDAFIASGGQIVFNNDVSLTHSTDLLTVAGGSIKLAAGTTGFAPLQLQAGTNTTTAVDGAVEFDGQALFFSPDASDRRIIPTVAITRLHADNTLSDSTSLQKIFNASASGALTLPVGSYIFECVVGIDTMSATSGNAALSIIGAGGATVTNTIQVVIGIDGAQATAGAASGASWSVTNDAPAANNSVVTATTATAMAVMWKGSFEVTGAGTIIPSVDLITGGVTPAVKIGSYFMCWRMGAATDVTQGNWS